MDVDQRKFFRESPLKRREQLILAALIGNPLYANYKGCINAGGNTMVPTRQSAASGFRIRAEDITPCGRAILLNTSDNPTGATLSYEDLAHAHDLCITGEGGAQFVLAELMAPAKALKIAAGFDGLSISEIRTIKMTDKKDPGQ